MFFAGMVMMGALCVAPPDAPNPVKFERVVINLDRKYEASSAFDVDNDGNLDIVSGAYWYAGPDFKTEHKICDIPAQGEYYDDFGDYPMDVNGDGYTDIVTGGYWSMQLRWRENPKGQPVEWVTHDIVEAGSIERLCVYDLDRDGVVEFIPNETKRLAIHKLILDANGKGTGQFKTIIVKDAPQGHGLGFGDINSDGREDILLYNGWFEGPANGIEGEWVWHGGFDLGSAAVPYIVHDVNADGRNDLIVGEAHNFGLNWWEHNADGTFVKHEIDTERSQYHDMALADIDKDGALELITGQRYRAHCGNDPGENNPIGVYYFEINGGNFQRATLDYGPAGQASGLGIFCWIQDIDKNGWLDVVAPGKDGLYLFKNQGRP